MDVSNGGNNNFCFIVGDKDQLRVEVFHNWGRPTESGSLNGSGTVADRRTDLYMEMFSISWLEALS